MHLKATDWQSRYVKRLTLNGEDVTNLTTEFDTDAGWVRVLVLNAEGNPFIDEMTNEAVTAVLYGRVELQFQLWRCGRCGACFHTASEWLEHITTPHMEAN